MQIQLDILYFCLPDEALLLQRDRPLWEWDQEGFLLSSVGPVPLTHAPEVVMRYRLWCGRSGVGLRAEILYF